MEKNILWTIMVIVGTIKSILFFYRNRGEHSEREYIFLTIIIAVLIMAYYFINGKYVGYN